MRNKAKNFGGPKKIDNPRAKTSALKMDGSINTNPKEKLQGNR